MVMDFLLGIKELLITETVNGWDMTYHGNHGQGVFLFRSLANETYRLRAFSFF